MAVALKAPDTTDPEVTLESETADKSKQTVESTGANASDEDDDFGLVFKSNDGKIESNSDGLVSKPNVPEPSDCELPIKILSQNAICLTFY